MPPTGKHAVSASYETAERPKKVASQPATEEGLWRSQSALLMVPRNTSGQSMHSRIFWCADHALRGPVACAGPLRASWPGHTERWSLSKIVPRGRQNPGQISEPFQNGPNRKNRAKAKMLRVIFFMW